MIPCTCSAWGPQAGVPCIVSSHVCSPAHYASKPNACPTLTLLCTVAMQDICCPVRHMCVPGCHHQQPMPMRKCVSEGCPAVLHNFTEWPLRTHQWHPAALVSALSNQPQGLRPCMNCLLSDSSSGGLNQMRSGSCVPVESIHSRDMY